MGFQQNFRRVVGHFIVGNEKSASCCFVLKVGVGDEDGVMGNQPAVSINASEVSVIQYILCFAGRITGVIAIVSPYGYNVICFPLQCIRDINHDRQISSKVFGQQFAVDKHFAFPHNGFKMEEKLFTF